MSELIKRTITGLILLSIFFITVATPAKWPFMLLMLIALVIILVYEWPRFFSATQKTFWVLMPFYPIAPIACIILLHNYSNILTLLLLFGVSIHDTGSYIFGKLYGKHAILPCVSPGKTYEGFSGGYLCTLVASVYIFYPLVSVISIITTTFIFCYLALVGDLFESALKRRAHIKDSGTILPGHGGLLDRIDGMMSTVFFLFFIKDSLLMLLKK